MFDSSEYAQTYINADAAELRLYLLAVCSHLRCALHAHTRLGEAKETNSFLAGLTFSLYSNTVTRGLLKCLGSFVNITRLKKPRSSLVMHLKTSTRVRCPQGKLHVFLPCLRQWITDPRRGFEHSCLINS